MAVLPSVDAEVTQFSARVPVDDRQPPVRLCDNPNPLIDANRPLTCLRSSLTACASRQTGSASVRIRILSGKGE
jgi:hypothetical protein